jgi:superfamily II DNA/RNA helicase
VSTPRPARDRRRPARPAARATARPTERPAPVRSDLEIALDAAAALPEPPARSFAQLGLPDRAVSILAARGVHEPFAIQARAMPSALAGRDVLARAATGSGKTLAFGLPMLASIAAAGRRPGPGLPRGLVLAPTRELARQIAAALEPVATGLGLRVAAVYGGAKISKQIERCRQGVDVVIATPGRLIDLVERSVVFLDAITVAVVDEADHMADMGFLPDVTRILDATPAGRQCLLFSATLDRGVDRLVARYLSDPAAHTVAPSTASVASMDHRVFVMGNADKVGVAAEIARRPARTLFFVRTKHGADRLARQLGKTGVDAVAIHGNLNQNQRLRALDSFVSGRNRVLVATDVAARGLHVDDVDLVVHFDPPADFKQYVHRSGRTARAGAAGTVVSFVESHQTRDVARMHAAASVSPRSTRVRTGHPLVQEIARSGDPVTVVPATVSAGVTSKTTRAGRSATTRPRRRRPAARTAPMSAGR